MFVGSLFFIKMSSIKNIYNKFYFGFILSIIIVFFCFRPLNSPWHKFIAGDGLGYYAYLPATYIYHDSNYEFKWFNKVYNNNYDYCSFESPDQNFLVSYQNKKINKYYQGLSYIWLPFFGTAHIIAKLCHYPADGFSLPYQIAIGIASLCYLILGLFYLRKLLFKLFQHHTTATIVPVIIFYGSSLFYYGIYMNSLSHSYSFSFISMFLYACYCFFNESENKTSYLVYSMLLIILIICIRPINGLIVLSLPIFVPKNFLKTNFTFQKIKFHHLCIIALILGAIIHQFVILYIQTGTIIPYTYSNEHFYFNQSHFIDVLLSYQSGLFIYCPIVLISFFGVPFLSNQKLKMILPSFFLVIVFLYSSWWYWPITSRAIIDFYAITAILLGALITKLIDIKKLKIGLVVFMLCIGYYQLKSTQLHRGILQENYTYSEVFWRNFFRIHATNQYLIPPKSIIQKEIFEENFETDSYSGVRDQTHHHQGNCSILLNEKNPFSRIFAFKYPTLFKPNLTKKIRFSFWCYGSNDLKSIHIYLKFYDKQHQVLLETPFYINQETLKPETWDFQEFGYQLSDDDFKNKAPIDSIEFFIWNNENKGEAFIDEVNTEFLITNNSYEIIQ